MNDPPGRRSRLSTVVDALTTIAILVACGVLIAGNWPKLTRWRTSKTISLPSDPLPVDGARAIGSASASVVLMEFSDFQCPFCARFSTTTLPVLLRDYVTPGKVRFVFRHLPLERIHPMATTAAKSAECAARQGRFHEAHDWLFARSKALQQLPDALVSDLKLLTHDFDKCLSSPDVEALVRRDVQLARTLGVASTPAFLFGVLQRDGRVLIKETLAGNADESAFRGILNKLLR